VIEVPRTAGRLPRDAGGEAESLRLFPWSASDDEAGPRGYTGQSRRLRLRLVSHNKTKDFWERAFTVLISQTNSLTRTHALFLEWFALQTAASVESLATGGDGTVGAPSLTRRHPKADCLEIFEAGRTPTTRRFRAYG